MLSGDGGDTWRELDVAATSGASAQPYVLERQGRFYVFWNTRREPLAVHRLP
jgi:hypothetical protein